MLRHLEVKIKCKRESNRQINYITCVRTDGIGAQVQSIMSTMVYAKYHNMVYAHTPIKSTTPYIRYSNNPLQNVSPDSVEKFFSLGYNEAKASNVKVTVVGGCHDFLNKNPDLYNDIIPLLKYKYSLNPKVCIYKPNRINVAVHIRRGDISATYRRNRFTSNSYILSIINIISSLGMPFDFHIFSLGKMSEFDEFKKYNLYIDGDPLNDLHHLVKADVLVMSKSSFSYIAALLSDGVKLYEPFWHKPLSSWVILQDGWIDNFRRLYVKAS